MAGLSCRFRNAPKTVLGLGAYIFSCLGVAAGDRPLLLPFSPKQWPLTNNHSFPISPEFIIPIPTHAKEKMFKINKATAQMDNLKWKLVYNILRSELMLIFISVCSIPLFVFGCRICSSSPNKFTDLNRRHEFIIICQRGFQAGVGIKTIIRSIRVASPFCVLSSRISAVLQMTIDQPRCTNKKEKKPRAK